MSTTISNVAITWIENVNASRDNAGGVLVPISLNRLKSNFFAGISDTLKTEPSESVGNKLPRANRWVQVEPQDTKRREQAFACSLLLVTLNQPKSNLLF